MSTQNVNKQQQAVWFQPAEAANEMKQFSSSAMTNEAAAAAAAASVGNHHTSCGPIHFGRAPQLDQHTNHNHHHQLQQPQHQLQQQPNLHHMQHQPQQQQQQPHQHQHQHQHQQAMNHQRQQQQQQQQASSTRSMQQNQQVGINGQQQQQASGNGGVKKELPANGKKTKGRVRIKMEFIHNKLRRYTTFSKRKTGIMKKAFELATLTGTQVMLLVASETGHVYTFATRKLQPMIISDAGKALIQTCLNSPDSDNLLMSATQSSPPTAASTPNASQESATNDTAGSHSQNHYSHPHPNPHHHPHHPQQQQQQQQHPQQHLGSSSGGAQVASGSGSQASPSSSISGCSTPGSSSSPASSHQHLSAAAQQQHNLHGSQAAMGQQQQPQHSGGSHQQQASAPSPGQVHYQAEAGRASGGRGAAGGQQSQQSTQSQHNMVLAAAGGAISGSGGNNNASAPGRQQQQPTSCSNNTSASNDGSNNNSNQTTTDQRMSATGFEETELSYRINDDLNDRAFNNCLPISIGTIDGAIGVNSSASVITSPQAFNQTLQSQEAESNLMGGCSQQVSDESSQQVGRHMNGRRSMKNGDTHLRISNDKQLIEQQQQQQTTDDIQLVPIQQAQLPHFNYNPLYTGVQHQQRQDGGFANGTGSHGTDDKNLDGLNHMRRADDLLDGDDEDVLNDIYHYSDPTAEQSSGNKQQSANFAGEKTLSQLDTDDNNNNSDCLQPHYNGVGQPTANGCPEGRQHLAASKRLGTPPFASPEAPLHQSSSNGLAGLGAASRRNQVSQVQGNYADMTLSTSASASAPACQVLASAQRRPKKLANEPCDQQSAERIKRLVANDNSFSNFDTHTQNNFQSQQFTLGNSGPSAGNSSGGCSSHQLDLAEECNGLFVEYQTNRNSLGTLEELHSLNVTNCDSETLEEQINMLSSDDCFASNDDFQDFNIGGTNDHFLNMLFNGNNAICNSNISNSTTTATASTTNSINMVGTQLDRGHASQLGEANVISPSQMQAARGGCSLAAATTDRREQLVCINAEVPNVQPTQRRPTCNNKSANQNKANTCQSYEGEQTSAKVSGKKSTGQQRNRKNNQQTGSTGVQYESATNQHRITTTNTNRRLLPKKSGPVQNGGSMVAGVKQSKSSVKTTNSNSCWTTSPSSTSNTSVSSAVSPCSSSQFEYEAPYRQQLDNLRKKLKMDLPLVQQPQQLRNETLASNDVRGQLQAKEAPKSIRASHQLTGDAQAPDVNGCGGTTTYVLTRPIETSGSFDVTNGTIYLRTSNGLVPCTVSNDLGPKNHQNLFNGDSVIIQNDGFLDNRMQAPASQQQQVAASAGSDAATRNGYLTTGPACPKLVDANHQYLPIADGLSQQPQLFRETSSQDSSLCGQTNS